MAKKIHVWQSTASPTVTLAAGLLTITDSYNDTFLGVRWENLGKVTKQAAVAETANVRTATVTRAASTRYAIQIVRQLPEFNSNKAEVLTQVFAHTSSAAAASDESIVDAFVAQINAATALQVTAAKTAATTFTVTTDTGFPLMTLTNVGAGTITFANTTPGVVARNTAAALELIGVPEDALEAQTYVTYSFKEKVARNGIVEEDDVLLVIEDSLTSTVTAIDEALDGTDIDSTSTATIKSTVDPYVTKA